MYTIDVVRTTAGYIGQVLVNDRSGYPNALVWDSEPQTEHADADRVAQQHAEAVLRRLFASPEAKLPSVDPLPADGR